MPNAKMLQMHKGTKLCQTSETSKGVFDKNEVVATSIDKTILGTGAMINFTNNHLQIETFKMKPFSPCFLFMRIKIVLILINCYCEMPL